MPEIVTKPTLLEDLVSRRETLGTEWDTLIDEREKARSEFEERQKAAKEEDRPSDSDIDAYRLAEDEFRSASEDFESQLKVLNDRISQQEQKAERRKVAEENTVTVGSHITITEPLTYRKDNAHEVSYFRDLIATEPGWKSRMAHDWRDAEDRLRRHGREMEERLPKRELERKQAAEQGVDEAEREFRSSFPGLGGVLEASPFEHRVGPSRQPGSGGEFVPPLWLVEDDWIPYLRAGRVIAPLCRNMPVPPGTDTIKLPKIKLGTEVAPQLMDNAGVASRDIETTYVEAPIKTLAGQEDVAIQLIEQSPGQVFDRVVQEDLLADYNLKVDANISSAPGTNVTQLNAGTILGLFPATNWGGKNNESSSSPSPQTLYAAMGCNWSWIAKERYNVQNVHHVVNPRRAAYLMSSTDAASEAGRPFYNATDFPNFNTGGLANPDTPAEGFVMNTPLGPNVYSTVNIPAEVTAAGVKKAGESHDYMLSAKFDDVWFFESDLRTRVLPEVASGTLQVRFQVYAYVGLLVRYGPSIAIACGKPFEAGTLGGFTF